MFCYAKHGEPRFVYNLNVRLSVRLFTKLVISSLDDADLDFASSFCFSVSGRFENTCMALSFIISSMPKPMGISYLNSTVSPRYSFLIYPPGYTEGNFYAGITSFQPQTI